MWYKKEQIENGEFVDNEGNAYTVNECYRIIAPDGRRNAELGYTEFENMDECLKAWGLTRLERNVNGRQETEI